MYKRQVSNIPTVTSAPAAQLTTSGNISATPAKAEVVGQVVRDRVRDLGEHAVDSTESQAAAWQSHVELESQDHDHDERARPDGHAQARLCGGHF